jgi:hypothetical protein
MVVMYWPLHMQGTDTGESEVRGGGGGRRDAAAKKRENQLGKKRSFIHWLSVSGASEDFLSEPKGVAFCM